MKYFIALLAVLISLAARTADAYLIDKIAAVVNDKVITQSELDRSVEIENFNRGRTGPAGEALRMSLLDSMIDRMLILEEARKFDIVQVTGQEAEEAVKSIKDEFASDEDFKDALSRDGLTEDELKDSLKDQMLAVKYVDKRVRYFVRVTLEEQKKFYDENRAKFDGKGFGEVQEQINNILVEKQTEVKLDDYIAELRSKARIEIMK
jgi:peptidyl-prolyl cis-trans isomerase SurA